jgi:diguanylate cyclase (GGDEF)-like protein
VPNRSTPRTPRGLLNAGRIAGLAALLFAGASVVAGYAVQLRQDELSRESNYDVTWTASQASVEFGRLAESAAALAAADDAAGIDAVGLRLDVFLARFGDFSSQRFRTFLSSDREASAAAGRLSDAVGRVGGLVEDLGRSGSRAAVRQTLAPMSADLAAVAGAAHRFGIDLARADQASMSSLYRLFVALTSCMAACCALLVAALFFRNCSLSRARRELARLADHDPLTGLPNRAALSRRLADALEDAGRRGEALVVYALDLDRFKAVNDTFGHAVGDELLRQVTRRIDALLPSEGFAARLGGDEFVVVQPRPTGHDAVGSLASGLVEALCTPVVIAGQQVTVGASVGVSAFPADGSTADALLTRADLALYEAKRSGAGRWAFSVDDIERVRRSGQSRMATGTDLRDCGPTLWDGAPGSGLPELVQVSS